VTAPETEPAHAGKTRRWNAENTADTRSPDGPEGRVYTVPFAQVWDELIRLIERRGRWTLEHRDEELGIISVSCRTLVLRFVDDLTLWVSLDEDGLTRVEALSRSRVGKGDWGVNGRRIERLLNALDEAVGAANRLLDRRTGTRPASEIPDREPRPASSPPSDTGATFA